MDIQTKETLSPKELNELKQENEAQFASHKPNTFIVTDEYMVIGDEIYKNDDNWQPEPPKKQKPHVPSAQELEVIRLLAKLKKEIDAKKKVKNV